MSRVFGECLFCGRQSWAHNFVSNQCKRTWQRDRQVMQGKDRRNYARAGRALRTLAERERKFGVARYTAPDPTRYGAGLCRPR